MDETSVQRRVWAHMSRVARLFRVNTGRAWVGAGKIVRNPDGSVTLPAARPITLGLGMIDGTPVGGAGDLVGWTELEITPAMVGHRLPVFTTFECKESGGGTQREGQKHFVAVVKAAGGIAGIVNGTLAADAALAEFRARFAPH